MAAKGNLALAFPILAASADSATAAANHGLLYDDATGGSARMDREQAAEVKRHLLNASRAFDRAAVAIHKQGKAERARFDEMLFEVYHTLHFGLLRTLYSEHPELEPPDPPHISSTLRWENVSLPDAISEAYLDALIFAMLKPRLQKMAKIVGDVFTRCEAQLNPIDPEIIAARIIALAEAGRIEGAGDLRMWRHSEVRRRT